MINPSANGWIEKFFIENHNNFNNYYGNIDLFYENCRTSGFIYGHIVNLSLKNKINTDALSYDEVTKLSFLTTLYNAYTLVEQNTDTIDFVNKVYDFYKIIQPENLNFIKKMLPKESRSRRLETVLDNRIKTNNNIISKNFSHIITNALLFIDVLAFHYYLAEKHLPQDYLKTLETDCIKLLSVALNLKTNKSKYDELLIKLFENSIRYTQFSNIQNININEIELDYYKYLIEKYYLLDITEMALWSDEVLEQTEKELLEVITKKLQLQIPQMEKSNLLIDNFIREHKNNIQFFNYSNPIKHFYEQTNATVSKLIIRNKKRLLKELKESKELMFLLAKSTKTDLSKDEKRKMKKQLLDICKTIPSLTIFLLPGGGLLLPILIKFIPQLLPSAFNENLDD